MADEKKPEAKPADPKDSVVEIAWLLITLFAIFYILNAVFAIWNSIASGNTPSGIIGAIVNFIKNLAPALVYLKAFSIIFSIGCIFGIIYLFRNVSHMAANERKLLYPEVVTSATVNNMNPHWERILNHIESLNENDWRLAILEADIMLSGLLDSLNLPGDTMGDKLKAVEKSDFTNLDQAWEAHKIRNQIAHEGASFNLNQREAKRVIELYRVVFEEFRII